MSQTVAGKLPPNPTPPPLPQSDDIPQSLTLLTRLTLVVADPSQSPRLANLASAYSLIAVRPTNEKALLSACNNLDCDIISLDLSVRLLFHFKFKTVASAIARGVRFEICYSPGITGSGPEARRNLIANATALIRATRGRGIIISSEAKRALGVRAPWDVVNLACVWGLPQDRAKEAICEEARKVVALSKVKRTSFRGVVDVVYGGDEAEKGKQKAITKEAQGSSAKRKAASENTPTGGGGETETTGNISKREMKRRAKKARLESATEEKGENVPTTAE